MLQADNVTYVHGPQPRRPKGAGAADVPPGRPGVDNISVAVERGDVVGILGPNGSGKTTLLRLLSGLLLPASGSVRLGGARLSGIPRRSLARRLAMVPQETHLAFEYSVLEIALMGRYPHLGPFELESPRDLAIARDALDATGTGHLAARSFSTLSGGEKQRVVIASALAQEADILLLDEPTASLDLGFQLDVAALLRRLNRERGLTMVVATHDLNFAAALCGTLLLVKQGRVLAHGPIERVLTSENIAALYGVTADVHFHAPAGHLTVVPLGRVPASPGGPA
ncbi:MAG: ABC transporter ATP-binding protein [Vicinamibacterales bacterium]|nr:ABC transporter ATP-binding protein [Vicinamibacterales bacterium]